MSRYRIEYEQSQVIEVVVEAASWLEAKTVVESGAEWCGGDQRVMTDPQNKVIRATDEDGGEDYMGFKALSNAGKIAERS